jgi:serine/threonine protein kinase
MEYASGGELFNKITAAGKIAENEAKNLFAQVISAVEFMVCLLSHTSVIFIL